ncbi:MAG: hypothetical protein AAFZ18_10700, partial [Myxococcota bacterium]
CVSVPGRKERQEALRREWAERGGENGGAETIRMDEVARPVRDVDLPVLEDEILEKKDVGYRVRERLRVRDGHGLECHEDSPF